jgi:putative acetyltransferase
MVIRLETPSDLVAIRAVETAAFPGPAEAELVDDLRKAGDVVFSLVAVEDEQVVGHAVLSKMKAHFLHWRLGRSQCCLRGSGEVSAVSLFVMGWPAVKPPLG